ncbi:MAG: hypothetical protein J6N81_05780 [Treponema sp.]|nr:hypothetical protein [Treponema sp.]
MEEIIVQIKAQQEINFINVREQIQMADLETVFDGENNSRYIFHYLHSLDRFFINPCDYVYEGEKLFGIPENLSVIDSNREGYVADSSIVIEREKLLSYLDYVEEKINLYFETLTAEELLQKPKGCDYSRLELILAQFRHLMWHVGLSSGITFSAKGEWNHFTGLSALNKKFFKTSGK